MSNYNRRLDKIQERAVPAGKILVCFCAKKHGCVNVKEHDPDCPALSASEHDTVIIVRYDEPRS